MGKRPVVCGAVPGVARKANSRVTDSSTGAAGFNWARLTKPRKRDKNIWIVLTLCLCCLGFVTGMVIVTYVKVSVHIKEQRDSVGNNIGTGKFPNSDSQITNFQKQNADSVKDLKASLLSELQSVKQNVTTISDEVQKLEESLSRLRQTLQKQAGNHCPENWMIFAGKCYFFSLVKVNFENARRACQSNQSNLVVINNRIEQDFLANRAESQFYWIGLTDLIKEGEWCWVDDTSYSSSTSFWKPGQPDNHQKGEHCAHLIAKGQWNDNYCTREYKYICEKTP
ncbi:CD209 antigen-like protein E isoform X2 [Heterodontus francisci]|uniref:CD209 antigen-like protein E isoform X2 n=1 Tax=Heterodontus francisci TaxID=7792 RepID=UPI00355AE567